MHVSNGSVKDKRRYYPVIWVMLFLLSFSGLEVTAAEISLRTRVLLEFGKLVPPYLVEPAVTLAGEQYALGFRTDEAGPFLVEVQKDYLYDPVHRLTLDVYLPQFAATPLPAVLLIHGGGWKYFNKGAASGYARYLASNGFAAVTMDYRLSSEANWPKQLDDLRTAVRWLHGHGLDFGIDPFRMAVLGDSAGAHLAAMLALRGTGVAGHKISAVVAYYGVYDMVALVSHDETARDNPINQLLGDAPNLDGRCREASPIYHVSAKSPPFFLVHGMNDSVVPVEQTTKFAAKLKEAGVPVQTVYVNGADHLLLGLPGQVKPTLPEIDRMVLDFLQKWLWGIN